GHLDDADIARYLRMGVARMNSEQGLALFDAACAGERGHAAPVLSRLDLAGLRSQASAGELHPLHRGLVRVTARRTASGAGNDSGTLLRRLAGLSEEEQLRLLLDLVR
ncbi:hypothetical protein JHN52_40745, partial [Streptomyces sp. MBT97]|uniref:hypothetical protein n=1 Tax=Streptomyces sp. MBT97 TaxID=2800411 RepID=UPI00190AB8E2